MGIVTGGDQGAHPAKEQKPTFELGSSARRRAGIVREEGTRSFFERRRAERSRRKLRVLKFGGTSVGDGACIRRVVDIIRTEMHESNVVVVVSAMSGVTNKLVAAAKASESGDRKTVAKIFEELRTQHEAAAALCRGTILLGELTPRTLDAVSSLGERLSAPLVAAALEERGVASKAIGATELVVTDSAHGAAEPLMDLTRERCQAHVRPLLQQGIVPVVTGFIGATVEGVVTTLGRNGSDYSATILGAALDAHEVVIWTDVDGVLTVDPRLVPGVSTIPEISYHEAAELSYFGAKVLHPKTLRPVTQASTPIWIRNTFAPERGGTKITPDAHANGGGAKRLPQLAT